MPLNLATSVAEMSRVGKTAARRLQKLGIKSLFDLIFYYPFRWEDFSRIVTVQKLTPNDTVTVRVKVQLIANRRSSYQRKNLTEALVADDTGSVKVIWFNQPFITKLLAPGAEVYLSGRVGFDRYTLQLVNPVYEKVKHDTVHTARLVPIYPLTQGLTQKQLRFLVKITLSAVAQIPDLLPDRVRQGYHLLGIHQALKHIHFPTSPQLLKQARRRLAFEELFLFQLQVRLNRLELDKSTAPKLRFSESVVKKFVRALPFELTDDQRQATWQIISDTASSRPMTRLLEGDVGAGKTVVATIAMVHTSHNGYQSVLMAPTEVLAYQHYQTISKFLKPADISHALLTRSHRICDDKIVTRKKLFEMIASGEVSVVIGTHALIQEAVHFPSLALAVIDEQHRFGVAQRKRLKAQSGDPKTTPHLLSMTATPIPRSLALTLYGDLDISLLRHKPKERQSIVTDIIVPEGRSAAYQFIRDQVLSGRQAFIVCPLIDPSDTLGVASVTEECERLKRDVFTDLKLLMLHGKMKSGEKEAAMASFLNHQADILVSTSVVEVGIDVPNATVMMVEGAERFGLAQLHQFRGRVGRSVHQSYCFLCTESSQKTNSRLQALVETQDGFTLAERDLTLRGPGDTYGQQQSGWPEFKIATPSDIELLTQAKEAAQSIMTESPDLAMYPILKAQLAKAVQAIHIE